MDAVQRHEQILTDLNWARYIDWAHVYEMRMEKSSGNTVIQHRS
jgi:flavin-binding protein dodecin